MTIEQLLSDAQSQNIILTVVGDKLKVRSPKGVLSPEWRERLEKNKSGIIAALTGHGCSSTRTCRLSANQQSLWFLNQLAPSSSAYNVVAACRVLSPIDVAALESAIAALARRHEMLRTTYVLQGGSGNVVQHSADSVNIACEQIDAAGWDDDELKQQVTASGRKPFDLAAGPVFRCVLFNRSVRDYVLLLAIHHIACDAVSLCILLEELLRIYEAVAGHRDPELPPVSSYLDYAAGQQSELTGPAAQAHCDYWRKKLINAPARLELPYDYELPAQRQYVGSSVFFSIDHGRYAAVQACARQAGVTASAVLLTVFQLMLCRISGQRDISVGMPTACRTREAYRGVCGYFVNPVVIRTLISDSYSVREQLARTGSDIFGALEHQDYPFPLLVEKLKPVREPGISPFFQVLFNVLHRKTLGPAADFLCPQDENHIARYGPLTLQPYPVPQQEGQFDLTLEILDSGRDFFCVLKYSTELFASETVVKFRDIYLQMLDTISSDTDASVSDIIRSGGEQGEVSGRVLSVAATFTAEPLQPALSFWLHKTGIADEIRFAPYNQVFQQLLDPGSIFCTNTCGANIILVRIDDWLKNDQAAVGPGDADEKEYGRIAQEFVQAVMVAVTRFQVPLVIVCCPPAPALLENEACRQTIMRTEQNLCRDLKTVSGVTVVTAAELLGTYPVTDYYEPLGEQVGHIPYSENCYTALATVIARRVFCIFNKPHKAIVLDCDRTLWDGIVGEDGVAGVCISADRRRLQEFMLQQRDAGILLCLCSKNSETDVMAVFDSHPDMLLRREHLTAWRINWSSKPENIVSMAQELNIGLDSLIFIDDSPLECAEMRQSCPEVLTLQLPEETAIETMLNHVWVFDRFQITAEDASRSRYYQQARQRDQFCRESINYADFIKGLHLSVTIEALKPEQVSRVSQLTYRTNQFNLSTIRRTESEITDCCLNGDLSCYTLSLTDRFGDYGLVGVVVLQCGSEELDVDTFLLSCRALGRGVEHRMLSYIGRVALSAGLPWVRLVFRATDRNLPMRRFLDEVAGLFAEPSGDGCVYRMPAQDAVCLTFDCSSRTPEGLPDQNSYRSSDPSVQGVSNLLLAEIACELDTIERIQSAINADIRKRRFRASMGTASQKGPMKTSITRPESEIEQHLVSAWTKYLHLDSISVDDNFFDLGGSSVLIPQIAIYLKKEWDIDVSIIDMFQYPTVRALSDYLTGRGSSTDLSNIHQIAQKRKVALNIQKKRMKRVLKNKGR